MILPSITLGWFAAAALLRLTRSSMLEVLDSEYIKLARAKGVAGWKVVWKHAFRNALIVPLTYAGLLFAGLMTGAVVTETVFAWPGLGRLAVQAVFGTDFAVISAIVLIATALYLALNLCDEGAFQHSGQGVQVCAPLSGAASHRSRRPRNLIGLCAPHRPTRSPGREHLRH
jgi:ABC-type dipeptide/oligopeptide/nickel transport system permease component